MVTMCVRGGGYHVFQCVFYYDARPRPSSHLHTQLTHVKAPRRPSPPRRGRAQSRRQLQRPTRGGSPERAGRRHRPCRLHQVVAQAAGAAAPRCSRHPLPAMRTWRPRPGGRAETHGAAPRAQAATRRRRAPPLLRHHAAHRPPARLVPALTHRMPLSAPRAPRRRNAAAAAAPFQAPFRREALWTPPFPAAAQPPPPRPGPPGA